MLRSGFGRLIGQFRHPTEEELFLFADGGLHNRRSASVGAHVKRCWTCRREVDRQVEAIHAVVEYRDGVQTGATAAMTDRFQRSLSAMGGPDLFRSPRRFAPRTVMAWASLPALAAATFFLVNVFSDLPAISADTVIERASAAEKKNVARLTTPVVR